jgi:hypothetical protein
MGKLCASADDQTTAVARREEEMPKVGVLQSALREGGRLEKAALVKLSPIGLVMKRRRKPKSVAMTDLSTPARQKLPCGRPGNGRAAALPFRSTTQHGGVSAFTGHA